MAFNGKMYRDTYLKSRDAKRGLPDDLLERYAITLPASDAEIAAQVGAVRSFWNGVRPGVRGADVVKLCRSLDDELQAEYGAAMLTAKFWTTYAATRQSAAKGVVSKFAERLKTSHGRFGVVTRTMLEAIAPSAGFGAAEFAEVAKLAGLRVVDQPPFAQEPPIDRAPFLTLQTDLQACGARTIPELLHPGSGAFRIVRGYESRKDRGLRLDLPAVITQHDAAQKTAPGNANDARRAALQSLQTAARNGVDLGELTLAHLTDVARTLVAEDVDSALEHLIALQVDKDDAALIVVVLAEAERSADVAGVALVDKLLGEGRLGEARHAAQSMTAGSEQRAVALKKIDEARMRLDELLAAANAAVAGADEVKALALLREAQHISAEDANDALTTIPLPPPAGVRAVSDADSAKLFWNPTTGHDEGTTYLVTRSEARCPTSPADGHEVGRLHDTTFVDPHSPVARTVYFSVFAVAEGRPVSRPASTSLTVVPPVDRLSADVGPNDVTVHWSTHPACSAVEAFRTSPGRAPQSLPVANNSCHLAGLVEGEPVHVEVTAVYRAPDGSELRSSVSHTDATPRSEASPIRKLRARAVDVSGDVRIRISWAPVDNSEVRILASESPPPWVCGSWITHADMAAYGGEVSGRRASGRSETAIEAQLPPGVHHLVPVSIGGTGIVVGSPTMVGVTDPIRALRATPFGTYATLSWEWPSTAQLAEVTWELDGDADVFTISRSKYQSDGGARVPLGRNPSRVEVRAVIQAHSSSFTSPPVAVDISAINAAEVRYHVASTASVGRFGGRSKKVTFTSAEGGTVHVRMVASPGGIMPTSPDGQFVLLDTSLDLAPSVPVVHAVTVPRAVSRPYWVRCFIVGGRGRLVDPPISELKE